MNLFSQRQGHKPVKSVLQIESMDPDLRNGLWNTVSQFYWREGRDTWYRIKDGSDVVYLFLRRLWSDYFKLPMDGISDYWPAVHKQIMDYFFGCNWYEVYDFIEFIAKEGFYGRENPEFVKYCNTILERESAGYRFVGGTITPITSEEEIAQIEKALNLPDPLKLVSTQLKNALDLLANRQSPDYRNSINESISAVETLCRLVTGQPKVTLGDALKKLGKAGVRLHPALKKAFGSLYGYTSDTTRHGLMDEPNLGLEDAMFMLVACSAFVNYLVSKSSKAGIKF